MVTTTMSVNIATWQNPILLITGARKTESGVLVYHIERQLKGLDIHKKSSEKTRCSFVVLHFLLLLELENYREGVLHGHRGAVL